VLFERLHERTHSELVLMTMIRDEFLLVRGSLAARGYPNFSGDTKLCLVVDKAQILSDRSCTSFVSSSTQGNICPMYWAMSSGDGVKEYGGDQDRQLTRAFHLVLLYQGNAWSTPFSPSSIGRHVDRAWE
jgi:hypothetical protein